MVPGGVGRVELLGGVVSVELSGEVGRVELPGGVGRVEPVPCTSSVIPGQAFASVCRRKGRGREDRGGEGRGGEGRGGEGMDVLPAVQVNERGSLTCSWASLWCVLIGSWKDYVHIHY